MSHLDMLEFEQARTRILNAVRPLPLERLELSQALGRVLGVDLVADSPLPSAATSAMDGYALCVGDLPAGTSTPTVRVVGESRAGVPAGALQPGSACRIFTGAVVPRRADAVVLQEDVERDGNTIRITELPGLGQHIRDAGSDLAKGEVVLPRGTRLNAFALGAAAALNQAQVLVFRAPRVTIVCTGDELRPPGAPQSPGSLPESNSVALAALAQRAGASVRLAPLTPDDPAATREQIEAGLTGTDLLLTVGGVSVGDHDVVRPALVNAGVEIDFWKVRIKPGKPLVYARTETCTVLGLPGNPVSAQVTFCLFGLPLLRAMQGDSAPLPRVQSGALAAPLRQKPGRLGFHRVQVVGEKIVPLRDQSSGSVSSLARADALALMPSECEHLAAGDSVEFLWLDQM